MDFKRTIGRSAREILSHIDDDARRSIDFLRRIVQVPTVWGDEKALGELRDFILSALADSGMSVRAEDSGTSGLSSVLGTLPGTGGGKSLILCGHMEVYPPSTVWPFDPFDGIIRDGNLYGAGAADMKGGLSAMLMAARYLAELRPELRGTLSVLAIPNHFEGGVGTRTALRRSLWGDYAMVCEPSDLKVIVAQRGILYVQIRVRGVAAHTTAEGIGVNAIEKMAALIPRLRSLADGRPTEDRLILNVAMIDGGTKHNLIPERCHLTVDIRYPPYRSAEQVLAQIDGILSSLRQEDPQLQAEVEVEETCRNFPRTATQISPDSPLIRVVEESHVRATGRPAEQAVHLAWPDTPIFNEHGIAALCYGPGSMQCYWTPEFVPLSDYLTAIKVYVLTALHICA